MNSGEEPEDKHDLPRAFDLSDLHAAELWALRSGGDSARLAVVRPTKDLPERSTCPPRYETIALHEFHTIGPDGLPAQHRTIHVIRALDDLTSYSYRFGTDAL